MIDLPFPELRSASQATRPAGVVAPGMALIDTLGRRHRDLRVSLTDGCSLRAATACPPRDWPGSRANTFSRPRNFFG